MVLLSQEKNRNCVKSFCVFCVPSCIVGMVLVYESRKEKGGIEDERNNECRKTMFYF